MNFDEYARSALVKALRSAPARVRTQISDDVDAGEFLTALIELVEAAPNLVGEDTVDRLAVEVATMPAGDVHRDVAERAIQRYRTLASA